MGIRNELRILTEDELTLKWTRRWDPRDLHDFTFSISREYRPILICFL